MANNHIPPASQQTLIHVDPSDTFLSYEPRVACHSGNGILHRAVLLLLYNAEGKVLLQKRKHALWDGFWDLSGATHPLHLPTEDESYEEAGQRLLRVEWGIEAPVRQAFPFTYFSQIGEHCENELCALLTCRYDGPVAPNPEHAYGVRWATLDECIGEVKKDSAAFTPWARVAIERLEDPAVQREFLA